MPEIRDEEFGSVTVRRSSRATTIRIRVAPHGGLYASVPLYAPLFLVRRLLKKSREQIRQLLRERHTKQPLFTDGMQIGKSHTLTIMRRPVVRPAVTRHGLQIIVTLPEASDEQAPSVQQFLRDAVSDALRTEAKQYLPRRLSYIAQQHGYTYEKVRFSHAAGRWGSCSSQGTISLNIALMKLPFELIDYVLAHELSHTKEMNHSPHFWHLVETMLPDYKKRRKLLKTYDPSI